MGWGEERKEINEKLAEGDNKNATEQGKILRGDMWLESKEKEGSFGRRELVVPSFQVCAPPPNESIAFVAPFPTSQS